MGGNHTSIDAYQVYHYTSTIESAVTSKIVCFRDGAMIGEIQFYRDGESIPKSLSAAGKFLIRYSDLRFGSLIATFRESSSVNVTFDGDEISISSGEQRIS